MLVVVEVGAIVVQKSCKDCETDGRRVPSIDERNVFSRRRMLAWMGDQVELTEHRL